jgi:hypothetical protein
MLHFPFQNLRFGITLAATRYRPHKIRAEIFVIQGQKMNRKSLLHLYDQELRINIEYPDMRKEVNDDIVRFIRPAPGMSFVLFSRLDPLTANSKILEQIQYFKMNQLVFSWTVCDHDFPVDLGDRLVACGFEPDEEPGAVMIKDIQNSTLPKPQPNGLEVRRIRDAEEIKDVIEVEEQVWGGNFDWMMHRMGNHMKIPGYISIYAAYDGTRPVSTGWTYYPLNSQFASLWGGSTIKEYRNRGIYTDILAARMLEAKERGIRYLVIEALPTSRPIVSRHGFEVITYAHSYDYTKSD